MHNYFAIKGSTIVGTQDKSHEIHKMEYYEVKQMHNVQSLGCVCCVCLCLLLSQFCWCFFLFLLSFMCVTYACLSLLSLVKSVVLSYCARLSFVKESSISPHVVFWILNDLKRITDFFCWMCWPVCSLPTF